MSIFKRLPVPALEGSGPKETASHPQAVSEASVSESPTSGASFSENSDGDGGGASRAGAPQAGQMGSDEIGELGVLGAGGEGMQVTFRFEPFILALDCRTQEAAARIVSCAIRSGFRESGKDPSPSPATVT